MQDRHRKPQKPNREPSGIHLRLTSLGFPWRGAFFLADKPITGHPEPQTPHLNTQGATLDGKVASGARCSSHGVDPIRRASNALSFFNKSLLIYYCIPERSSAIWEDTIGRSILATIEPMITDRRIIDLFERHFDKRKKFRRRTACWEWQGGRFKAGYGRFVAIDVSDDDAIATIRRQNASRISFKIYKGPIPSNILVRHTCDNPPCINPDHLILGTHADNWQDMVSRGRNKIGCKNSKTRLN
jgi:hypothetical protein